MSEDVALYVSRVAEHRGSMAAAQGDTTTPSSEVAATAAAAVGSISAGWWTIINIGIHRRAANIEKFLSGSLISRAKSRRPGQSPKGRSLRSGGLRE